MKRNTLRNAAAGLAIAATLGVGAVPATAQETDWTGPYFGLLLGKGFANVGEMASTGLGWTYGIFGGYNIRADGHLLAGIDADFSRSGRGTADYTIPWTSSVRLRVGFAGDHLAIYGTFGFSVARFNLMGTPSTEFGPTTGFGFEARLGPVIARIEYVLAHYGNIGDTDVFGRTHEIRMGIGYAF